MYVHRSLRAMKDKLIDDITEKKVIHWYYKQRKKIYHSSWFMVANQEITDQFIRNKKNNPNKVHDLTGEMKKS